MKNLLLLLFSLIFFAGCANSTDNGYDDSADLEFLEEYRLEEGVIETDSGLLYKVLEEGEGEYPGPESAVIVRYTGELINGREILENSKTGDGFLLNDENIIPGFIEGLQLMRIGEIYELVAASELAFNDGRVVIFEVEILSSIEEKPEDFLEQNAEKEDVAVTDSGLQYRIIEEGDGKKPANNSEVSVVYTGTFTNGHVFDTSDGDAIDFDVNRVIPGFGEGLQLMQEGAIYELFIPSDIGYGKNPPPSMPPGAVLVFEVELKEVDPS